MNNGQYPPNSTSGGGPYGNQNGAPHHNQSAGPYNSQGSGYSAPGANQYGHTGNAGNYNQWSQNTVQPSYNQQQGYNTGPTNAQNRAGFPPPGYGQGSYGYGPGQPGSGGRDANQTNRKNGLIIGISTAVVVLALAIGGMFYFSNSSSKTKQDEAVSPASPSSSSSSNSGGGSKSPSSSSKSSSSSSASSEKYNTKSVVDPDGFLDMCTADKPTLSYLGIKSTIKAENSTDNDVHGCTLYSETGYKARDFWSLKAKPKGVQEATDPSGLPDGWVVATKESGTTKTHFYMRELSVGWIYMSTEESAAEISDFMEKLENILQEANLDPA